MSSSAVAVQRDWPHKPWQWTLPAAFPWAPAQPQMPGCWVPTLREPRTQLSPDGTQQSLPTAEPAAGRWHRLSFLGDTVLIPLRAAMLCHLAKWPLLF